MIFIVPVTHERVIHEFKFGLLGGGRKGKVTLEGFSENFVKNHCMPISYFTPNQRGSEELWQSVDYQFNVDEWAQKTVTEFNQSTFVMKSSNVSA